jgi:glucan phosphorylase
MNVRYTPSQVDFIANFVGSDTELTIAFNRTFSTDVKKATLRKKRQRMGITKTAEQVRLAWLSLSGLNEVEIVASLRDNPPKDIHQEQRHLAEVKEEDSVDFGR